MCDKVYVFEKLTLLEGVARYKELFSMNMLKRVYVYSFRPKCLKNGNPRSGMLLAYAWFVFDKNHKGKPTIDWITRDSRNNYC